MKSKILAATALISMMAVPNAAMAQTTIEIGRQTFLDNGAAPQSLNRNETAAVSAAGTHSLTCTLAFVGAAPTGTALEDFNALSISNSASATGNANAPVTGSVTLTYNGRINPKGMAVGDAMYQGSFDAATVGAAASPLSCSEGATLTNLGFRAAVPGTNGEDEVLAQDAVPAVYGKMQDEPCRAARKLFVDAHNNTPHTDPNDPNHKPNHNIGYAYETHCPDIIDYSNVITAAVPAVEYKAAVPATNGTPQIDGVSVTYTYAPSGASFSQSSLTVTVEGQTFSF